ncbi:hypothetical protein NEMBOFW57_006108 [Staphylotrichum longicolle]|uniref:non-specific serine/threonine protein kinase n=1 Tax=Staphylotrichum longicolle TaxID=669026 RepID=A0AAD4F1F8_9PEZI|nr:hypothetical protein NEMBOFW57_006108 [Staphylotrichum longicolle]
MESMENHFEAAHQDELLDNPLSSLLSWSAVQRMGIESCPLCSSCGPEDSPELVDHVLRHAYEFALRALPWPQPIVHNLNVPPGSFNPPEDMEHARGLEQWIDEAAHESVGIPELTLCDYDKADHSVPTPTEVSEYSDYFGVHSYFDDKTEDKSSRPQGDRSIASQLSTTQSNLSITSNGTVKASFASSSPEFVLLPLNSAAQKVVDHERNSRLRLRVDDAIGLWLSFSNPEKQVYTLGCDEADIFLPDARSSKGSASISALHASFQVVEETGAVLLWDLSESGTVEPLLTSPGSVVRFRSDIETKSVLVANGINSRIALGNDRWYLFEIIWQNTTSGEMIAVKKLHGLSGKDLEFATREIAHLFGINEDQSLRHFLASHQIIHYNIKPENILWEYDYTGNFHFRLSDIALSSTMLITRTEAGSSPFTAPELLHRQQPTTAKADIWSLFVVIVWIRVVEFRGECSQMYAPKLHAWLVEISKTEHFANIQKMVMMDPKKRPSATQQLARLEDFYGPITMVERQTPSDEEVDYDELGFGGDNQTDTSAYYEPYDSDSWTVAQTRRSAEATTKDPPDENPEPGVSTRRGKGKGRASWE